MTQNEGLPSLQPFMAFMVATTDMVATTRRTIKTDKARDHEDSFTMATIMCSDVNKTTLCYPTIPREFSCLL